MFVLEFGRQFSVSAEFKNYYFKVNSPISIKSGKEIVHTGDEDEEEEDEEEEDDEVEDEVEDEEDGEDEERREDSK